MADSKDDHLQCGSVVEYSERAGYGYVQLDDASPEDDLVLVHRHSIAHRDTTLRQGDRVSFRTKEVPRGVLAVDVRPEIPDSHETVDDHERAEGTVDELRKDRGFGFLVLRDGRRAFFHRSHVVDGHGLPHVGSGVACRLVWTSRGLQAHEIQPIGTPVDPITDAPAVERPNESTTPSAYQTTESRVTPDGLLADAVLARESRDWDRAEALYEDGLKSAPSVQLILSYAAMQKNRGRRQAAMSIYRRGIELFPSQAKLREDAGVLAARLGQYRSAITLLHEALDICRGKPGEKGVLLALARTHYRAESFAESAENFERAARVSHRRHSRLADLDDKWMSLARVRSQHHRGNIAVQLLESAGFTISHAERLPETTEGADLVVQTASQEFIESYGISGRFLVRVMFKARVAHKDLAALDRVVGDRVASGRLDENIVLLIVASLDDGLQRTLSRRIEQRTEGRPAIVPLPQSVIERQIDPQAALRATLDRWLYRRDLFAVNSPVVGRRFFGRGRALARLREAIESGTASAVFGLRKVGKTSLLKEVARRGHESGDLVVFTDLLRVPSDVTDCRWLYWKIATELRVVTDQGGLGPTQWRLGGEFQDFLDIPESFPVGTAFDSDLMAVLNAVDAARVTPRPRVILLLDEIERLLPTAAGKPGFHGFFDFFSYIRGVCQERDSFVPIIAGANAAITETAQFGGRDNPVFNSFDEVFLAFLEPHELETMLRDLGRGMGVRFARPAVDQIYRLFGGHPYFTRQFCSFLAARYAIRPMEFSVHHVRGVAESYLEQSASDFLEIMERLGRDFPEERDVCLRLAEDGGSLALERVRALSAKGIRHLLAYQIAQVQGETVSLGMEMMSRWLQRGLACDDEAPGTL